MTATLPPSVLPDAPVVRRRRRVGPWIATGLVVAVSATLAVLHSPWMALSEIEIVGAMEADVAGRIADLGVGEGALMVWLDTASVEAAVAADPWVRDVRADRVFPDRLVVEVLEQQPALSIETLDGWLLVATDGTVLEDGPSPEPGLLRVEIGAPPYAAGSRPVDPAWGELVGLAAVLDGDIAAASVVTMRGAELWVAVGAIDVRLGRTADLADKGRVFQELVRAGIEPGATIDVVSPLRPAVIPPAVPVVGAGAGEGEVDGEGAP